MATEPVKKPAKLTTKQRKLIKGVAEGKTQKQAAIDAGYSPNSAESIASQELNKTTVKATLLELMEVHGLDDASLLKVHSEMIQATRGEEEAPDWQARGKGIEMAYRLKGAFTENVKIEVSDSMAEMMKAARQRVKQA